MKKYFLQTVLLSASIFLLIKCTKHPASSPLTEGNWVSAFQIGGFPRMGASSWVIGDTGYLVGGYSSTHSYFNDLWQFDPVKNNWVQKADFPGTPRQSAVGFSIGNNGYLATGYNLLTQQTFADCWQYNPTTNAWTKMADIPDASGARYGAVGFTIDNNGYVGTGYNNGNYLKDFWKFDPVANTWTAITNVPLSERAGAVAFTTYDNTAAYIVTGTNGNSELTDFWKYSPSSGWARLKNITNDSAGKYDDDYTDIARDHAVALVEPNNGVWKAYITVGVINSTYTNKTWEYDFVTDLWTRKTSYERAMRQQAVSWSFLNLKRGFVGTGISTASSLGDSTFFDDIGEWFPAETLSHND